MRRDTSVKSTQGSSGCLCLCAFLALFATISPYWIYRYNWYYNGWSWNSASSTVASGSYVVSSSSTSWQCAPLLTYCSVAAQWNYFSDFNSTLCTGEFYEKIGQYGFCDSEGGNVQTPSKIKTMQALNVTATVLLFVSFFLAVSAPKAGSKGAFAAAFFTFAACCISCASFSVAVSFDYYKKFSYPGWYLPYLYTGNGCPSGTCITLSPRLDLYWGPGFYSMVTVFITSFFISLSLCAAAKSLDDEDDGAYGGGQAFNNEPYDPLAGQEAPAGNYAYGGNPKEYVAYQ